MVHAMYSIPVTTNNSTPSVWVAQTYSGSLRLALCVCGHGEASRGCDVLGDGHPAFPVYLLIPYTNYFKQMCCIPESDVVAVEPQPRLDAVAVDPRGGPDAGWLLLSSSGVGSAIPIAWLSQAICSLVKGVAMSSRVTERTQTGTEQGLVATHYDC